MDTALELEEIFSHTLRGLESREGQKAMAATIWEAFVDEKKALIEAGTGIVLSLWSYLSSVCQRIIADVKTEIEEGELNQCQRKAGGRGKGKGKGMGRGRGMDRGGGGRGRG